MPGLELVDRPAAHRYGVVFVLALVLLVFVILAPSASWARATAIALEGASLVVVIATARERSSVRRARALAAAAGGAAVVVLVAAGVLGRSATFALSSSLSVAIVVALVVGAARLVRERGVTLEVVAAALAIYVLIGLVFAWVVLLTAEVGAAAYFAGGQPMTPDTSVYFSFTVLTTTGFGDYAAATRAGHAIAVVEMLIGQLYLVTVIGVLVGAVAGARRG